MTMVYNLIGSIIWIYSILYLWHKLFDRDINYKSLSFYLSCFLLAAISIFNSLIINKLFNIVVITIILMIFVKYIFRSNLQKTIITPIYTQIIAMILESIYAVVITIFRLDVYLTLSSPFIKMISNIIISAALIIVSNTKLIKRFYKYLLKITDKVNNIQLSTFCILVVLTANILTISCYYKIDFKYLLTFNIVVIVLCFIIVLYSFKTQNSYNKVSGKYNLATKSLKDYEDMINLVKIRNHEDKNQLLTIRAMVVDKDEHVLEYIDSILENKYKDDEKLFYEVSVIPSGGLRAIIYSEILKIKSEGINYTLNVDKKISTVDLIELGADNIVDICKIVGVFIDNSIDAVSTLDKRNIDISIYVEHKSLIIKISNNYDTSIDISKIGEAKYTTKGKNHGYGLSLVKSIIENNQILSNKRAVSKDIFSQLLIVDYK